MSVATLKLAGKEYVVKSRKRYEQLLRAEEDMIESRIAQEATEAYLAGKLKTISLEDVTRRLGM